MLILLILFVTVILLCYFWVKERYQYWDRRGFLSVKPTFPFGNLGGVGLNISQAEAMDIFYKQFKGKTPAVGLYYFLTPTILVLDPELIRNISCRDFSSFHDRYLYYNKKDDPLSANVLTLQGKEWKDIRTKLTPFFTSGKMKMMFGIVNEIGDNFIKALQKSSTESPNQEMRTWFSRYTCDVIGNIAFGIDCNCLENPESEFKKCGARIFDLTTFEYLKFMFSISWPNVARKMGLLMHPKKSTEFFLNTFLKTIEEREDKNITRPDFVQLLIQMKNETSGAFTNTELAAESFIFYVGGFETSSTLMTFCVYELALNPDIQQRLRDEIREFVDIDGGELTYNTLYAMKYLDMVINETLRKYPPGTLLTRKCVRDFKVPESDLKILKGENLEISIYAIHNDEEYYPSPEVFDPERFTDENIRNRPPFTFIPFGEGPRSCIGSRFGVMQVKVGIVKMLLNFEFSICEKTNNPLKFEPAFPLLAPKGGMWIGVTSLKS